MTLNKRISFHRQFRACGEFVIRIPLKFIMRSEVNAAPTLKNRLLQRERVKEKFLLMPDLARNNPPTLRNFLENQVFLSYDSLVVAARVSLSLSLSPK